MEKPFSVIIEEFREKIVKLVNESGFPAYVLIKEFEDILFKLKEQDVQIVNQYKEEQEKNAKKEGEK